MSKKQVCPYQWDYIISCNENGKIDHIDEIVIGQDVGIETNIENIACLGMAMSLCNKQHLSNIWGSIYKKVKQYWGSVEKNITYKRTRVFST